MQLAVLGGSSLLGGGFLGKAAMFGASVGMSLLMKGKSKPQGKLNDLRVSSASYGRGIPGTWGTIRVTGNIFWSTDFREEKVYITQKGKTKTGGKGEKKAKKGKAQPVFKYFANFAVGLCEGVVDDVLRIWADNNLIYDKLNPDNEDLVGIGFSQQDDSGGGKQSNKGAGGKKGRRGESGRFAWRFYSGTDYQMPDPYMEKITKEAAQKEKFGNGELSCPAYRDLAYLMFEDFALEDFGNRIPTITVEVTKVASRRAVVSTIENLDPPEGGWRISMGSAHIDPARGLLSVYAAYNDLGEHAACVRIFDIEQRKEVRRHYFGVSRYRWKEQYVFWTHSLATNPYVFVTPEMVSKWAYVGMTHKGDIVMRTNFGNANSTIAFVDGVSGKVLKLWGGNTHSFGTGPAAGIFYAYASFPFPYTKFNPFNPVETGAPKFGTVVRSVLDTIDHVFDDDYNLVAWITREGPRRSYISPGAPGTDSAMFSSTTNFGGTEQFIMYKNSMDAPIDIKEYTPLNGAAMNPEKEFARWPPEPLGIGTAGAVYMSQLCYVIGAEALCGMFQNRQDTYLVKFDPVDGSILWQYKVQGPDGYALTTPYNTMFVTPQYSNTNVTSWARGGSHIRVDWRSEKVDVYAIDLGYLPTFKGGYYYWSEKDAYIYITGGESDRQLVIAYLDRKIQTGALLTDICMDVAGKVGIKADRVDVSGLVQTDEVVGYMYEQPIEARSIIEELADIFMFDAVESDNKLKFRNRGNTPVLTIKQDVLGIVEADFGGDNEYYSETRMNESELPKRGTITYFDPKEDYEQATQIFSRPSDPIPVMNTNEVMEITANMALNVDVARSLISRVVFASWSERTSRMVTLPRDYLDLDPTDVITIELDNGESFEGRITDITIGANLEMEVAMVSQVAASYSMTIKGDSTRGPIRQPATGLPAATPIIFNVPYLDDSDVDDGAEVIYYWGAASRDVGFRYGVLQAKYEDTVIRVEGATTKDVLWGYVMSEVPPPPVWNAIDDSTVLELAPAFDFNANGVVYEWESIPDNEWPSTNNMIIIGDEIILFKDVEVTPEGTVKLSTLVRGFRGTNAAAEKHKGNPKSEKWALVIGIEVRQSQDAFKLINQEQEYNVHTGNSLAALTMVVKDSLDGATRKPFPVGNVRRTPTGGNVKIDWTRGTRYNGDLKDSTATVPLNEENERYTLYLLKAPYDATKWNTADTTLYHVVKEDLTTGTYTFTAAELTSFGLTVTSDLHVVIYQNSTQVGLGFPHGLTLPYSMFGV